jgi:hypothetical protein
MLQKPIGMKMKRRSSQEPSSPFYLRNGHHLYEAALDHGWIMDQNELIPSWDQQGLIRRITIRHQKKNLTRQLLLPANPLEDDRVKAIQASDSVLDQAR